MSIRGRVCYGKRLRGLPRGMRRRGHKLYYRHTVPLEVLRLLNRLEIWRSLRTDSLDVAMRRLPGVVARLEMEIEHVRAMADLPVEAMLKYPQFMKFRSGKSTFRSFRTGALAVAYSMVTKRALPEQAGRPR